MNGFGVYQERMKHFGTYQMTYEIIRNIFQSITMAYEISQSISIYQIRNRSLNIIFNVHSFSYHPKRTYKHISNALDIILKTQRCSGISNRIWSIHFWMTTGQKSPTSGSFIHPRLGEVRGGRQSHRGL
ncbi:unnamed protein product [Musa textilis]